MRSRLLFLKDILNQKEDSRISLFVELQLEQSTKGDWMSTCLNDFKLLNISESLEGIKSMKITKYRKIINERIQEYPFSYLMKKRKSKGSELSYPEFQMAEYLLPNDKGITIEDQQYLFGIRNKMVKIPANFGSSSKCVCGMNEEMCHIYDCEQLNKEEKVLNFEKIFSGSLAEQIIIMNRFRKNMEIRDDIQIVGEDEKNRKE